MVHSHVFFQLLNTIYSVLFLYDLQLVDSLPPSQRPSIPLVNYHIVPHERPAIEAPPNSPINPNALTPPLVSDSDSQSENESGSVMAGNSILELIGFKPKQDEIEINTLRLGFLDYRHVSDMELQIAVRNYRNTEIPSSCCFLHLFRNHGLYNLNRHMQLVTSVLIQHKKIILSSNDFRSSAVRSIFANNILHRRQDQSSTFQLKELVIQVDSQSFQHCIPILTSFHNIQLDQCDVEIPTCVLFQPAKNQDHFAEFHKILFNINEAVLPDVKHLKIIVDPCRDSETHSNLTLENLRWFKLFLEKLNVEKLTFVFDQVKVTRADHLSDDDQTNSIENLIYRDLGVVWQLKQPDEHEKSHNIVTYQKDTSGFVRTEDYIWIRATPFWIAHERRKSFPFPE